MIGSSLTEGDGPADTIYDPRKGEKIAEIAAATPDQASSAIAAARAAFDSWSRTTPAERSLLLLRLADAIDAKAESLAARPRHNSTGNLLLHDRSRTARSPVAAEATPKRTPAAQHGTTPTQDGGDAGWTGRNRAECGSSRGLRAAAGGRIVAQRWHMGRMVHPSFGYQHLQRGHPDMPFAPVRTGGTVA